MYHRVWKPSAGIYPIVVANERIVRELEKLQRVIGRLPGEETPIHDITGSDRCVSQYIFDDDTQSERNFIYRRTQRVLEELMVFMQRKWYYVLNSDSETED